MSETTDRIVAWEGEVMLLGWGHTSTRGKTVTFQLPEESEGHPFAPYRMGNSKRAGRAGQRFMCVLVQLDDDERPVEKTPAQICYLLCQDELFRHFLGERSFVPIETEQDARAHICEACGIKSRGELDRSPRARAHWDALIYQPWLKHKALTMGVI